MGHVLVESAATEPFIHRDISSPGRSAGPDGWGWETTEHKALSQAAEAERNELLEQLTVLQKRVVESSNQVLEVEKKLQEEQWRSHMTEQQFEMLQVDPKSSTTAQSPVLRSRKARTSNTLHVGDGEQLPAAMSLEMQVKEPSTSLEIHQEENKDLKAALEKATRKREEDYLNYRIVMGKVRDKFPEALQQYTQGKS